MIASADSALHTCTSNGLLRLLPVVTAVAVVAAGDSIPPTTTPAVAADCGVNDSKAGVGMSCIRSELLVGVAGPTVAASKDSFGREGAEINSPLSALSMVVIVG